MNARDYLNLLRESKLLILAVLALALLAALGVTIVMPKKYSSEVTFYVVANASTESSAAASDSFQGAQLSSQRVKSYIELLTGPRVAEEANQRLGLGLTNDELMSRISATSVADTVIITMSTTDGSPGRATQIAGAVSDVFTRLVVQLETPPSPPGQPPVVSVQVVQPPTVPDHAVSPLLRINLLIGGLLGLMLGIGIAIARRALTVKIRTTEMLQEAAGATVLGVVPEDHNTARYPISLVADPGVNRMTDARSEAYRRIRTNLELSGDDQIRRVLLVTSALPREGRSITACNLATGLARVGSRVLLIEGDLRRPRITGYLGLDPSPGLVGVLTGEAGIDEALQRWAPGRFDVLAAGSSAASANELLSTRQAGDLFDKLRSRYEFVVIDTPPLLPVADAASLGVHADGAVLVAEWGRARRPQVEAAVASLHLVAVPVIGAVLSRIPRKHMQTWSSYLSGTPMPTRAAVALPEQRSDSIPDAGATEPAPRDNPVVTAAAEPSPAPQSRQRLPSLTWAPSVLQLRG